MAQNRHVDQWDHMIEDLDINPHTYGHLIFEKEARNTHCKKIPFLTNGPSQTG